MVIPRDNGEWQLIAYVQSGKGKKGTTGKKVSRKNLAQETVRLVNEARGIGPGPG